MKNLLTLLFLLTASSLLSSPSMASDAICTNSRITITNNSDRDWTVGHISHNFRTGYISDGGRTNIYELSYLLGIWEGQAIKAHSTINISLQTSTNRTISQHIALYNHSETLLLRYQFVPSGFFISSAPCLAKAGTNQPSKVASEAVDGTPASVTYCITD